MFIFDNFFKFLSQAEKNKGFLYPYEPYNGVDLVYQNETQKSMGLSLVSTDIKFHVSESFFRMFQKHERN